MGAASPRWWVVMTMVRLPMAEAGEQLDHLADGLDVHVGEGLVEQEQLGDGEAGRGRARCAGACLGSIGRGAVEIGIEADLAQGFGGVRQVRPGIEAGEVAQVFLGGQLVVEHGGVAHVADALAGLVGFEDRRRV